MYKNFLEEIQYCVSDFDTNSTNYNVFKPSEVGIKADDSNLIYIKEGNAIPDFLKIFIAENVKYSKIFIGKNLKKKVTSYIYLKSDEQLLYIGDNVGLSDLKIFMQGNKRFVIIGEGVEVIQYNSKWVLGGYSGSSNNGIIIGDHCLIGGENVIRTSDGHPIIDLITSKQINIANKPVIIEPYVWLGQRVSILKNVTIGACSVCGMGAVISKSCEKFSAVVGNPAKSKNIYGKLWKRSNSNEDNKIFEFYKRRFILGERNDNN